LKLQLPVLAVGVALALMSVVPGAAARSALTSSRVAVQTAPPSLQAAVAAVRSELKGIPQQGMVLGSSSAPITVFEYADLICPTCATAAGTVVASVIKRFVRSGEVNIEFEPIVESPRSEQLALGAFAAGEWSLGWDYAQLAGSLGLNGRDWLSACRRRLWPALIEQAAKVALVGGFTAYPVFIVRSSANGFGSRPFVRVLRAPVTLAQLSATIRRALRAVG
jgi:hypothetical protein